MRAALALLLFLCGVTAVALWVAVFNGTPAPDTGEQVDRVSAAIALTAITVGYSIYLITRKNDDA